MKKIICLTFLLLGCKKVPTQPVVIITLDTTRADRITPYSNNYNITPNIEKIARKGIVFTDASSVAPITLVAHSSIFTGLYPYHHGVRNNGTHYLTDEYTTLAEILRENGYKTAAFVSAAVLDKKYGLAQGFEIYDDNLSTGIIRLPRMVPDRPAEVTTTNALKWLNSLEKDQPFFLWIHLYDPHAPYLIHKNFSHLAPYESEIAYTDNQIEKILTHPRVSGSIIFILADHGESLGEHKELTHALLLYQPTIHIPFILYYPGVNSGTIDIPISQVDVVPTVLDLLNLDTTQKLDGVSLLKIEEKERILRAIYMETWLPFYTYRWSKMAGLRKDRWKYIDSVEPDLYDLVRDPKETIDILEIEQNITYDLRNELKKMTKENRENKLALDPSARAQLEALGYISIGSEKVSSFEGGDPEKLVELHTLLEKARNFMNDRMFDKAIVKLEQLLKKDPYNIAALRELAISYARLKEFDKGRNVIAKALNIDPESVNLLLVAGTIELLAGNYNQALKVANLIIEKSEHSVDGYVFKLSVLNKIGRNKLFVETLKEAIRKFPNSPTISITYAKHLELDRNPRAALKRALECKEINPFIPDCWIVEAYVYVKKGEIKRAIATLEEGYKKNSQSPELLITLGDILIEAREYKKAIKVLKEALSLAPKNSQIMLKLAKALKKTGQEKEAKKIFEKIEIDEENLVVLNNIGLELFVLGEYSRAREIFKKVLDKNPEYLNGWINLSAVAGAEGKWEEVIKYAEKSLLIQETAEAHFNIAKAYYAQGNNKKAYKHLKLALSLNQNYALAKLLLAKILLNEKKVNEAKKYIHSIEPTSSVCELASEINLELDGCKA